MARKARHGSRTLYVRGCRCQPCTDANTLYQRELNARRRGETGPIRGWQESPVLKALPALPTQDEPPPPPTPGKGAPPGPVEAKVRAEIDTLSAAAKHPGMVEAALAMARLLDKPQLATTHPSAQRQLVATLDKLWTASVGRKGKLASVAAMSPVSAQGQQKGETG